MFIELFESDSMFYIMLLLLPYCWDLVQIIFCSIRWGTQFQPWPSTAPLWLFRMSPVTAKYPLVWEPLLCMNNLNSSSQKLTKMGVIYFDFPGRNRATVHLAQELTSPGLSLRSTEVGTLGYIHHPMEYQALFECYNILFLKRGRKGCGKCSNMLNRGKRLMDVSQIKVWTDQAVSQLYSKTRFRRNVMGPGR